MNITGTFILKYQDGGNIFTKHAHQSHRRNKESILLWLEFTVSVTFCVFVCKNKLTLYICNNRT